MPISVVCGTCGKKLRVPDERAGKMAKCPGCMNTFLVTAGGAVSAGPTVATTVRVPKTAGVAKDKTKVSVSWGFVVLIVFAIAIPASILAFVFGPVRVRHQWDAMVDDADSAVKDVVGLGLYYHLTGGVIDPKSKMHQPSVREGPMFFPAFLVMSLPEAIDFKGTTTEGEFKGKYFPRTGEVECDAEIGGLTFAGLDQAVHHGGSKIHITGREKNHNATAEVNGKKADMKVLKLPAPGAE
jgi:hypothetical protein